MSALRGAIVTLGRSVIGSDRDERREPISVAKSQDPRDAASRESVRAQRVQELDVPVRSVHANPLPVCDALGGVVDADDRG